MGLDNEIMTTEMKLAEIREKINRIKEDISLLDVSMNRYNNTFTEQRNRSAHLTNNERLRQDKELLIGKLPTVLLSTEYFPNNESLVRFSENSLKILLPKGHRSKKEIIGIVVTEIAKLDSKKITEFMNILDRVMEHKPKGEQNFFEEWEKVIKDIRFR